MLLSMLDKIKKSVVFIGRIDEDRTDGVRREKICATGFLVRIAGTAYLVTARHVIFRKVEGGGLEEKDEDLCAFLNLKIGRPIATPFKNIKKTGARWICHDDPSIDIAIIPFALGNEYDAVCIEINMSEKMDNLVELDEVIYLSYQSELTRVSSDNQVSPIVRSGRIARKNHDESFIIDGFTFPGNSGSPVFSVRQSKKTTRHNSLDLRMFYFVGLICGSLPYEELAISPQTGDVRVIFQENTGLSKVGAVEQFKKIIRSPDFLKQFGDIKKGKIKLL